MPTSIPWNRVEMPSAGPSSLRYQGMSWYFSGDQQETWQTNPPKQCAEEVAPAS